jgi:hypothetical protein
MRLPILLPEPKPMAADQDYLLAQIEPWVEIARTQGPAPLHFLVPHQQGCPKDGEPGLCPCRPLMKAEVVTTAEKVAVWYIPNPPSLCPGDSMNFDWEVSTE